MRKMDVVFAQVSTIGNPNRFNPISAYTLVIEFVKLEGGLLVNPAVQMSSIIYVSDLRISSVTTLDFSAFFLVMYEWIKAVVGDLFRIRYIVPALI